jgi:Tfp pilus assembly protein PilF
MSVVRKKAVQETAEPGVKYSPPVSNALQSKDNAVAKALFKRGVQSLNDGDGSQAAKYLEQAAMNCPELPNVHYALATAYAQLGDVFSAKKACGMELALQPTNRGAAELLERIDQAVNEYRRSLMS